ncbi:hypothetical protein C900_02528 [Fulvivirga imtechensis AK7]|uniref:Sulfotransferase n=1 Tax=Fulvivirga imtechensis AK7 TaxID=1237149 RepID=L8JRH1_9BACT|nr:sulfotransferase [Fulvivirga imtechensis]ELR71465.1 hypothetical protein C900_02528 [Fulvivirga imtechensis AK7]
MNKESAPAKPWAKVLRKMLGQRLYSDIRANFLFRSSDSPFPLYPDTPFNPHWDHFLNADAKSSGAATGSMVYIVSPTQRSGTNFLGNLLERHPQLQAPYGAELPMEQCLYSYSHFIKNYCYKTVSTWKKWVEGGDERLEKHAKMLMKHMGDGLISYFKGFIEKDCTLLMKTPDAGNLDNFFHMFPEAKVVILIRDGRDTMESFSKSWGGSGAFRQMSQRWSQRVDTILKFQQQADEAGYSDQHMVVTYERLNENTPEELKRIFNFLHINPALYPWDQVEEVPILGSSAYKGDDQQVHWKPIEKTKEFKPNQKWVSWSSKKKATFKAAAGKNLVKLGFANNNDW